MATLTVWKFNSPTGAEDALGTLRRLQTEQLITLVDGAVVTFPAGANHPKTHQLHSANAVVDRVADAFREQRADMELIQSNLTHEQEAKLRETFGEEPVAATSA